MIPRLFVGGLLARAACLASGRSCSSTSKATWTANTVDGLKVLDGWYNTTTGLWETTGWWNSANCLTVLADYALLDSNGSSQLGIPQIIQNTYEQAQKTVVTAQKTLSVDGMPSSSYSRVETRSDIAERGFTNFLNDYYDDEGWWALALIHSYDLGVLGLGDQLYLEAAVEIFEDMRNGTSTCGGIYWSKVTAYTNAIANELYLSVAASLANRASNKAYFLDIAQTQWAWFKNSGMINSQNLINDGLTSDCKNNGGKTWTYNQGVVLGGLVELYKATFNATYITEAQAIATAAIAHLSKNGTLYEGCEPDCGADGAQFKGVFMRNLRYLYQVAPTPAYKTFILDNANSIWTNDRDSENHLGVTWTGPYAAANAGTQSSALDALVGAIAVL